MHQHVSRRPVMQTSPRQGLVADAREKEKAALTGKQCDFYRTDELDCSPAKFSLRQQRRRQHKPSDSPGRRRRALSRLPAGPVSPSESRRQNLADNPPRVQTTTKAKAQRVVFAHEVGVFLAFGADVPGNVPRCRIFRSIDLNSARASAARKLDHAARGLLREAGKPQRCLARASAPRSDSRNTRHGPSLRPGGPN